MWCLDINSFVLRLAIYGQKVRLVLKFMAVRHNTRVGKPTGVGDRGGSMVSAHAPL